MNDSIEARLEALGLALPATEGESYYGAAYGTMKPFHISGSVPHLSGHVPVRNGVQLHPWRLGETVSVQTRETCPPIHRNCGRVGAPTP